MPRIARVKGEFLTYHIIQRGNERKNIFISDDDRIRFLETIYKMKEKYNFELVAYCLMDNHVHLLIKDNGNDISRVVKSINISYAYYFNHTYKRVGHLFQDRFKSEVINNDNYMLSVSAYIHNNPVKAGIVKTPQEYKWSSFGYYLGKENYRGGFVYTERILSLFSNDRKRAMEKHCEYVLKYESSTDVIDVEEDKAILRKENANYLESYEVAKKFVNNELQVVEKGVEDVAANKILKRELIIKLRKNSSLTLQEIGQLVGGISPSMVCKILKSK
ncbi:MAG: REP-associated tyrosine transposase [Anaerolineaceae bacterium]